MTVEWPGDWSACGVGVVRKRLPARKTLLILCVVIYQSNMQENSLLSCDLDSDSERGLTYVRTYVL